MKSIATDIAARRPKGFASETKGSLNFQVHHSKMETVFGFAEIKIK